MDKKKIAAYIRKYHLIQPGDSVLAAVSGGADSVALLLLLCELSQEMDFSLFAVHVEHGIRGEESLQDMRFTKELCEKLEVPLRICHVDAPAFAKKSGMGLEEAARKLRYDMLEDTALQLKLYGKSDFAYSIKIALAHHLQDQAETVLFRLARGSGLNGLSGMQPVRKSDRSKICTYIRPLLNTSRSEIEEYLAAHGQEYRVDSTNQDESYARNRIRSRVLPELSEVNAQAAVHIAWVAGQAAEISDYIAGEAAREFRRIALVEEDTLFEKICKITLNIPELTELHPTLQKELLRQALIRIAGHEKNITASHVMQLLQLTEKTSGKELSLPYKVKAAREFDLLVLSKEAVDTQAGQLEIGADQMEELKKTEEELKIALSATEEVVLKICWTTEPVDKDTDAGKQQPDYCGDCSKTAEDFHSGDREKTEPGYHHGDRRARSFRKYFAYEKLKDGFTIRHRQPGDFFPMKDGHRKKLKQYLIDEKIPVSERPKLWLLAQNSQVIWLFGGREDTSYRPDENTDYIILVEYRVNCAGEKSEGDCRKTENTPGQDA